MLNFQLSHLLQDISKVKISSLKSLLGNVCTFYLSFIYSATKIYFTHPYNCKKVLKDGNLSTLILREMHF